MDFRRGLETHEYNIKPSPPKNPVVRKTKTLPILLAKYPHKVWETISPVKVKKESIKIFPPNFSKLRIRP